MSLERDVDAGGTSHEVALRIDCDDVVVGVVVSHTDANADMLGDWNGSADASGSVAKASVATVEVVGVKGDRDWEGQRNRTSLESWADAEDEDSACIKGDVISHTTVDEEVRVDQAIAVGDFEINDLLRLGGVIPLLIGQAELPFVHRVCHAGPHVDFLDVAANVGFSIVIHIPPGSEDTGEAAAQIESEFEGWVEKWIFPGGSSSPDVLAVGDEVGVNSEGQGAGHKWSGGSWCWSNRAFSSGDGAGDRAAGGQEAQCKGGTKELVRHFLHEYASVCFTDRSNVRLVCLVLCMALLAAHESKASLVPLPANFAESSHNDFIVIPNMHENRS